MKELYQLIQDRKPFEVLTRLQQALLPDSEYTKSLNKLKTQWKAYEEAAARHIHPTERIQKFQKQELEDFLNKAKGDLDFPSTLSPPQTSLFLPQVVASQRACAVYQRPLIRIPM